MHCAFTILCRIGLAVCPDLDPADIRVTGFKFLTPKTQILGD
jgi:hypothetical protein